jgi:hypothetical protein
MQLEGLIVIDMQTSFDTAIVPALIERVVERIEFYKARELPILLVHYYWRDDTVAEVCDALAGYEHLQFVEKNDDDGGHEVGDVVGELIDTEIWEAVGVNFQWCVGKTCRTLAFLFPDKLFKVNLSCSRSQYTLEASLREFRRHQDKNAYGNLLITSNGNDIKSWYGKPNEGDPDDWNKDYAILGGLENE